MNIHKRNFKILLTVFAVLVYALVSLPRLISNRMVLQHNVEHRIPGRAFSNEQIKISFIVITLQNIANGIGNWDFTLPDFSAGGPYTM